MQPRQIEVPAIPAALPVLSFRTDANWTYVIFFACLGGLHLWIATLALLHARFEAYLSAALAIIFITTSVVAWACRFEMTIITAERRIRLRTGMRRFHFQRFIYFDDVHGVRVTLSHSMNDPASRIELLCDNEDIECPPTTIPRQEALCLAVLMGVRLIKVSNDDVKDAERIRELNC